MSTIGCRKIPRGRILAPEIKELGMKAVAAKYNVHYQTIRRYLKRDLVPKEAWKYGAKESR